MEFDVMYDVPPKYEDLDWPTTFILTPQIGHLVRSVGSPEPVVLIIKNIMHCSVPYIGPPDSPFAGKTHDYVKLILGK